MTGADMSDGATRHAELMAQARRHLIRYLGGEFPGYRQRDVTDRTVAPVKGRVAGRRGVCVNPDVRSD